MTRPDRNFWPGQATKEQSQSARANIVLADVGVSESTLARYYFAVGRMAHLLDIVHSEEQLDELVSDWIQTEFEDGCPLYLIADALSGLHHLEPYTRKKLVRSWRLYGIWRKFELPCRAPPITQDVVLAMAGWCVQHGELTMGVLLLLGFHCLLRTGELLSVRPCDFLLNDSSGLVTLPASKSGLRNNSKESVSIHDPSTLLTVRYMLDAKYGMHLQNVPCWDRSGTSFRGLFARIISFFELDALNFRPYSLRRGGATYEMQSHGLMERALLRGRWKSTAVARIYICDGLSLLPSLKMSWNSKRLVAEFSSMFMDEHCSSGKRGRAFNGVSKTVKKRKQ